MMMSLRLGDALAMLPTLEAASIDALVTDPPAGISFMGRHWDHDHGGRDNWIRAFSAIFRECARVLKPGAHGVVWALPRTSHWTVTALEDAGFEIRDVGVHLFGTGFPKSLNIGDGRGTALKPAAEHWILVRKPLAGTVAANVAEHGTGALNIDACRIAGAPDRPASMPKASSSIGTFKTRDRSAEPVPTPSGRWPANVTLDEEAAALLDAQSEDAMHGAGIARTGSSTPRATEAKLWQGPRSQDTGQMHRFGDTGGASRFFYVAKPDRAERDIGCSDLPARSRAEMTDREEGSAGSKHARAGAGPAGARNIHPTVKPVDLMRWLCRLVTPHGGLVLDPFMGSGTTGVACAREGFRFIGIEREATYMEIARRRIHGDAPLLNHPEVA